MRSERVARSSETEVDAGSGRESVDGRPRPGKDVRRTLTVEGAISVVRDVQSNTSFSESAFRGISLGYGELVDDQNTSLGRMVVVLTVGALHAAGGWRRSTSASSYYL